MEFNRDELSKQLLNDFQEESEQEEFEEEKAASRFRIFAPLIIAGVVAFVSYGWYADKFAIRDSAEEPKLVKADDMPVRFKPEDPGGMEIANRDKKVYDAISGDGDSLPKVIRLMPDAEEPVQREDIANGDIKSDVSVAELLDDMEETMPRSLEADSVSDAKVEEIKSEDKTEEREIIKVADSGQKKLIAKEELMSKDIELPDTAEQVKSESINIVPVPRDSAKPVVSQKVEKGYRVQLGSFKSREDALASWNIISKKHINIVGDADHIIEKADLGSKGVFYRLQLGEFEKESKSRQICQELTEQKQGCFIVKK